MRWESLQAEGPAPQARSSHTLTPADATHLVLWGGEHSPRVPVDTDLWIFDTASCSWSCPRVSGVAPTARLGHAAAAVGDAVYIHGGRSEVAETSALSDLYAFTTATATWQRVAVSGAAPPRRNFHAACAASGSLYIFGGCGDAGRLADLWRFDPGSGKWEELPSSANVKGRGGAGFVAAAGSLWVIGGFTGTEAADVHRFDLAAQRWEEVPSTGGGDTSAAFSARSVFARGSHSCSTPRCAHSGHVVVFGGEVDPSDQGHTGAGQFAGDTLCLDTHALRWHRPEVQGQAPCPRGWAASCEVPAGLVVSGGVDVNNTRLGDLHLLNLHA